MAIQGGCLCGKVKYRVNGQLSHADHCHCSMCRKAHGAAFATYFQVRSENFRWTCDRKTIREYGSSPSTTRSFCSTCGSVVPNYDDDGSQVFVPAGCHDHGARADAHIFVASKAPWFDITDDLPQRAQ